MPADGIFEILLSLKWKINDCTAFFLSIQAIAKIEQINHPLHRHNNISSLFNILSKDMRVESI